ncbi:hypothetical protein IEQ34_006536 [Dendrobium chrysotoxum]|uniref:Uncharacterized protein n=1 Tax=Dendrobium chrysotoxum TaxID=161865 RepID=A0AAV7H6T9_DENCH|nr:hypothetical protein IEQ34_006536 [Dendrobium chrysotoxum]
MARKKVEALKGKIKQIKSRMEKKFLTIKGRFLAMENWMESRFEELEEMMRKLMEMQSKTPQAVPISNPNQDLTVIPMAKSKGKEIGREEFDKESFYHQEPPPRAPIRDSYGGTARREFLSRGGGMANHYGRHFGLEDWATGDGWGQAEPLGSDHAWRVEER